MLGPYTFMTYKEAWDKSGKVRLTTAVRQTVYVQQHCSSRCTARSSVASLPGSANLPDATASGLLCCQLTNWTYRQCTAAQQPDALHAVTVSQASWQVTQYLAARPDALATAGASWPFATAGASWPCDPQGIARLHRVADMNTLNT